VMSEGHKSDDSSHFNQFDLADAYNVDTFSQANGGLSDTHGLNDVNSDAADAGFDGSLDGLAGSETVINAALLDQQYLNYTYNNSGNDPGGGDPTQYWATGHDSEQLPQWNGGSAETPDQISPYFTAAGFPAYASPDLSGSSATVGSPYEGHAFSSVEYQTTYLSHGDPAAHFANGSYPMSPVDYATPWASGPAFDFNTMQAYSAATGIDQMKLLEQNFGNFNLMGAQSMHDMAGYQAAFYSQAQSKQNQKSYASIAGQPNRHGGPSGPGNGYCAGKLGSPLGQTYYGALNANGFASPGIMNQVLDIGTWEKSEEISPANKVLTRSGKMVPTPSEKEDEVLRKLRVSNNYNPSDFNCFPKEAKFFVIKSYSEDDIHRSIKYNIWCSTERGNRKLNAAYSQMQGRGPVYLLYSVNGSGHFCGLAEMKSNVDYETQQTFWAQSKWKGSFEVQWIFVKDVPNSQFRHIRLENNENKPVTNSRDTQEIPLEKGKMMLKIFHVFEHGTSLFDDFSHYESREQEEASEENPAGLVLDS
jgi:hypothetical protein